MRRDAIREVCADLLGANPDDTPKRAGLGAALAVILPEVLDDLERLEVAVRRHRDERGDSRCWRDDDDLYAALPEGATVKADTSLPPESEFLESCARHCRQFWHNRQRLEDKDKALMPCEMTITQLETEVARLTAERDAFRRAVERTERGLTKPYRLGRLAALLSNLLATDHAGRSADPGSMALVLRDVADLYRGLVRACDPDDCGEYFPGLPPLGEGEGWPAAGPGAAGEGTSL
jgi:hypothetical protein